MPDYDNKIPYIENSDSSTTQITFDTTAIKMADGTMNLEAKLQEMISAIQRLEDTMYGNSLSEDTALQLGIERRVGIIESASSAEYSLTSGKIIAALGYTPAADSSNWGVFRGATASQAGSMGFVKAPVVGDQNSFLCGDGTWKQIVTGITETQADAKYMLASSSADFALTTDLNNFPTYDYVATNYLGIHDKADSAATADVTNNVHTSDTGLNNIYIKES